MFLSSLHSRTAATTVSPCTGARGATSHRTSVAANPPGCRSSPGVRDTGRYRLLPAGRPGLASLKADRFTTALRVQGQQAALDYLARYAFRIAITNNRILAVDDATVTYRYKDRAADRRRKETVSGHEFIRRFLQHVLPAGFHKVRYYGLWHASRRGQLCNLRNVLLLEQPANPPAEPAAPEPDADPQASPSPRRCPYCETGHLTLLRRLSPARPQGP
jgi:Putative transposase